MPAHPDPDGVWVGLGQQGDVTDQGTQQPLVVAWAGGRGVPRSRQVGGQRLQRVLSRQGRLGGLRGGQCRFGLGERGELGLPPGFQSPCHQPVFRFDIAERSLRAVCLAPGALHRQFGGAVGSGMTLRDLVGGCEGYSDLLGGDRVEEQGTHRVVHSGRGDGAALWGAGRVLDLAGVPDPAVASVVAGADDRPQRA